MITIALVGRPNVGKSSIFNRLAGKHLALVHNTPGLTRDYKIADATLGSYNFKIMDTAGLEQHDQTDEISIKMQNKTVEAVKKADLLLFVIDGDEGITPVDEDMARDIRGWNKPIILIVNKADTRNSQATLMEAFSLGLGEPVYLSTAHNNGFDELADYLAPYMPAEEINSAEDQEELDQQKAAEEVQIEEGFEVFIPPEDTEKPIKIAIVGRPNVGKSTLLNAIIGEERAITSPIAGTTRDTVQVQWEYQNRKFRLVDTAGLRKKWKITDRLEKMSAAETDRAIRLAHVVILVLDATQGLDHQDQAIAEHVIKEGRALIIALNKWDAVANPDVFRKEFRLDLDSAISQVKDVPYVMLSAIKNKGINQLLDATIEIYSVWQRRVSTAKLNRWLEGIENHNPPPLTSGRSNRLRYMTQIKSRPPTFAVWMSRPEDLADSYQRYLVNNLRKDFELPGIPIRLHLRKTKNPFAEKKKD